MSDLPQALRGARNDPPQPDDYLDQLLEEAASEIERLRAALEKYAELAYNGYNGGPEHARRVLAGEEAKR